MVTAASDLQVDPNAAYNPASPGYQGPQPWNPATLTSFSPQGLTGADQYNIARLTRAATYLGGATGSQPDLAAAVALAPTDWQTLDDHIRALGGNPGYGIGVGDLMNSMMSSQAPQIPVADINQLKQVFVQNGLLPPGTPMNGLWDDATQQAARAWDDQQYNAHAQGQKPGGASIGQFIGYLGNVLPTKVIQGLVGTAKFLFGSIPHMVERQAIEAAHAPGSYAGSLLPTLPFLGDEGKKVMTNPEVQAALASHGLAGGAAGATEDLGAALSMLPILKGAGVLTSGISGAAAAVGEQGVKQGLFTAAEGTTAKGFAVQAVRATVSKLADSPTAVGDLLNSYATRPWSLQSLGESLLTRADQIASIKESGAGQLFTSALNAATQISIGERGVGALMGGTVAPNIKLGQAPQSALSAAISNTPELGNSFAWGPFGGGRPLGNVLNLGAMIWAPTEALGLGKLLKKPTLGEVADSLSNTTGVHDTTPITHVTGMSKQALVDAAGGQDAYLTQGMRYWKLQASLATDASTWARDVKGLTPNDPAWADAVRGRIQDLSGQYKADPAAMEQAIANVQPAQVLDQFQYLFADHPEMLARRGQGAPVLQDWFSANNALRGATAADASVNDFRVGGGRWSAANQADIDEALQAMNPNAPSLAASKYRWSLRAANKIGEVLDPDATISLRRIDNDLGSAQQLGPVKATLDRLRSLDGQLQSGISDLRSNDVAVPNGAQLRDLQAAGFSNDTIDAMRDPNNQGLTNARMDPNQASTLSESVQTRIGEIRAKANQYYPETTNMTDKELAADLGKKFFAAPRDVTLGDDQLMQDLAGAGYQPIAMHPNTITLNHVGAGVADTLAGADRVSPWTNFLGISRSGLDDAAIASIQKGVTLNELATAAHSTGLAGSGQEVYSMLREVADANAEKRLPFMNLTYTRRLSDLGVTTKMMTDYGWTPEQADAISNALRRGRAFGFDASRPIQTAGNLIDALGYRGLPGIEDAIRTISSIKGKLPDVVQGPAGFILNLPENLLKMRDFLQFSASPYFTASRAFKTKILRGYEDLPFDFRPGQRIANMAQTSGDAEGFMGDFLGNFEKVTGSRGRAYAALMDDPDFGVGGRTAPWSQGLFGWSSADQEALDAWHMTQQLRTERLSSPNPITEPPIKEGSVRLYRGESTGTPGPMPDWVKATQATNPQGLFFARDLSEAQKYIGPGFLPKGTGRISYVDVPGDDAESFMVANAPAEVRARSAKPGEEYFVPPSVADARRSLANDMVQAPRDLTNADYAAVSKRLDGIYRYTNRSPLMKSLNYVFFPLSFNLKVASAMGGWMLQDPARILMTQMGLQLYNQANTNNRIGDVIDRYLPVVHELNQINFFAHGFGVGTSPLGGRNRLLYQAGQDAAAVVTGDPRIGAFVPVGVPDNKIPDALSIMGQLAPMWRQVQSLGHALSDQWTNVGVPLLHGDLASAGGEQWQVDNYYKANTDLKRAVSVELGKAGLYPSFSSLSDPYGAPNPKVAPGFYNAVQAELGKLQARYPAGARFAQGVTAESTPRNDELAQLMRQPTKTRAQASLLYFAAAYYQEQAQANTAAGFQAHNARVLAGQYQAVAQAMSTGSVPPPLPGALSAPQVATLRDLAQGLSSQAGPEFDLLYKRYFGYELGPISVTAPPPGQAR